MYRNVKTPDAKIAKAGPSQATGRVQPRRRPTAAIPRSRITRAEITMRVWAGPAAWRNVPQVVATGNTRLVTRNVMTDRTTTGRRGRPAAGPGGGRRPRRE